MQAIFILLLLNSCIIKILSRDTYLLSVGINTYVICGAIFFIISVFIVLWAFLETAVVYKILYSFIICLQLVLLVFCIYIFTVKTFAYMSSEVAELFGIKIIKRKFSVMNIQTAALEYASMYGVELSSSYLSEIYAYCKDCPTPELVKEYILNLKHKQGLWYNVLFKYICGTSNISDISGRDILAILNICISLSTIIFGFYNIFFVVRTGVPDGFVRTVESRLYEQNSMNIGVYNELINLRKNINADSVFILNILSFFVEEVRDYLAIDEKKANIRAFRAGATTFCKKIAEEISNRGGNNRNI